MPQPLPETLVTERVAVNFGQQGGTENFDVWPKYNITKGIGAGGFGFVVEAQDTSQEDALVAIKKLPAIFRHPLLTKSALREIATLRHFAKCDGRQHDNILGITDIIVPLSDPLADGPLDPKSILSICVVTEKMDMDLKQLIDSGTDIDTEQRQFFAYQILRGLKAIHSANVLHRDLKPGNLLINASCDLRIADFGLARGYDDVGMTQAVQTLWYRAPELLLEGDQETVQYTTAVDMWSLGCIFAELMLRRPLFEGRMSPNSQAEAIFQLLGTPEPSDSHSPQLRRFLSNCPAHQKVEWRTLFPPDKFDEAEIDLLSKMLVFTPEDRITVDDALKHPFLAEFHDPDDEPNADSTFSFRMEEVENPIKALLDQCAEFHPDIKVILDSHGIAV